MEGLSLLQVVVAQAVQVSQTSVVPYVCCYWSKTGLHYTAQTHVGLLELAQEAPPGSVQSDV